MNLFAEAKKVLDKDGKVNALGPYGKQKLTGREIQTYFRRNKVKDKVVRKAVEVALDLGGAMDIAIKAIKDFYGNKILKAKEVQTALQFANEESFKDSFNMLDEDYRKVIKMYPRDRDWKKLITKHKRHIDAFRDEKKQKDLPKKVEDDLLTWASQNGEVATKDDVEDFIMSILDEKYKPYSDSTYPRCVDFYIQFRGGRGDRITSPENKKDFEKAKKMIDDYCKKNKIKQKPVYSTPEEGSSAYKVGLMIDKTYSKTDDYDRGVDLQPLYVALGKLKTAEDHGGGWSKPHGQDEDVSEKKDKIKYRGNLRGLMENLTEGKNLMPDLQQIVDKKSAKKVGGIMVDMFTASMITQIYGKVNDKNKERMEKSNISTLVDLAQRMMQKMGDNITEKVEYVEYMFKNKRVAQKALDYFKKQQLIKLDINDDGLSQGELAIDAGKKDMTKQHKEVMRKFKPTVQVQEETLTEGTWAVPDSYPKLVKLNKFLSRKANYKTAQEVHKWHIDADQYFGDDSFSDDIDAYKTTLKGGERSFYDKGSLHGKEYLDRMKKYNKIKEGTDLRDVLEKQLSDWTGGVLKFKNHEIVQMPREWYMKDNPNEIEDKSPVKAKLESVDYHTSVIVEKFKRGKGRLKFKKSPPIKVEGHAVSRAQQAAIAIAKKKKNESVMDSYRQMWEESLTEEVQDITVDPKNKKFSSPSDQNYHGMEIAKQARRFGLKSAVLGKHVRIKGAKKKVNDFLRVVIGKERYGDPTNGDYTTPQINKMLTKGLK
jgi:hypothetical protein